MHSPSNRGQPPNMPSPIIKRHSPRFPIIQRSFSQERCQRNFEEYNIRRSRLLATANIVNISAKFCYTPLQGAPPRPAGPAGGAGGAAGEGEHVQAQEVGHQAATAPLCHWYR